MANKRIKRIMEQRGITNIAGGDTMNTSISFEGLDPIEGLKPSQYTNHVFLGEVVEKINEIIQKMNRLIELKNGELNQLNLDMRNEMLKEGAEFADTATSNRPTYKDEPIKSSHGAGD